MEFHSALKEIHIHTQWSRKRKWKRHTQTYTLKDTNPQLIFIKMVEMRSQTMVAIKLRIIGAILIRCGDRLMAMKMTMATAMTAAFAFFLLQDILTNAVYKWRRYITEGTHKWRNVMLFSALHTRLPPFEHFVFHNCLLFNYHYPFKSYKVYKAL